MTDWLINDRVALGDRVMDTAPEGGCKTLSGLWRAVCVASGTPEFGHQVKKGPVLLLDMETPQHSLENWLTRFSMTLGFGSWKELPITIAPRDVDFQFERKTALDRVRNLIRTVRPVFIRLDSVVAMLPVGRLGVNENSSGLGAAIGNDLSAMLGASPNDCTIQLAAHSKKWVCEAGFETIAGADMQAIVRGHGSIVGEGCDTGFIIKKLSENPLRFAVIPRIRRTPVDPRTIFIELMEPDGYGKGRAWLEEIPAMSLPPSEFAIDVYRLIRGKRGYGCKSRDVVSELKLFMPSECRRGIKELLEHKAIVADPSEPQVYYLNPNAIGECDQEYLKKLT